MGILAGEGADLFDLSWPPWLLDSSADDDALVPWGCWSIKEPTTSTSTSTSDLKDGKAPFFPPARL